MTTKQRFESKMRKKNWVITSCEFYPISLGGEKSGCEGGWEIEFETLNLSDDIAFDLSVVDDNEEAIRSVKYDVSMAYILVPGFMSAYNKETIFKIIDMLPVAKPITGNVVDSWEQTINIMIEGSNNKSHGTDV